MPKRTDLHKILVIGSGPIVIGQAAEFDYAGTQACIALKEEGYEVILCNSNPATIMTDTSIADKVYMEPLTLEFIARIIRYERPDAIVPGIGGQTGLNLAMQLEKKGILKECGVELLGTTSKSIEMAEDRELFKELCQRLGEPVLPSEIATSIEEAKTVAKKIGFPLVLRPAFTLGGTGGGFVDNESELVELMKTALALSPVHQVLVEKSIKGYKEIEYEVMRDANDTAIAICNMENLDPVGIHTGDSIVVCPSQTLSNKEYQMLRNSALKIIRELKIQGGCNVQFALDPESFQYYLIEVNPRVSRSSALASKASGYPIARVSAKVCVGLHLDEIQLANTPAAFEPALDYVVTKMPRFPFDKFADASNILGTQMKATGEAMAVGRTFEESLLKAIRSLELGINHIYVKKFDDFTDGQLFEYIEKGSDDRLYAIAELLWREEDSKTKGLVLSKIHDITKIDNFFLRKIKNIVEKEKVLKANPMNESELLSAKRMGFSDKYIAHLWEKTELDVFNLRKEKGILPTYKMIDSCSSEFESYIPYFYSTYEDENEVFCTKGDFKGESGASPLGEGVERNEVRAQGETSPFKKKRKIIVLGSGPIRIGQGVEFDYSTVHAVKTIKAAGYEAIIINNNPETVSTDYTCADKLYFEPLTTEDVANIVEIEKCEGVIASLGGQTAINLAEPLSERGIKIIGTDCNAIAKAEDRDKFEKLLEELNIPEPKGVAVTNIEDGIEAAKKIGFPVLVRPSFVLGGRAMQIVAKEEQLTHYLKTAVEIDEDKPVLVDKYIKGKEVEVDAICDGEDVFIPGIMELVERTGVHSGDSISVYPTYSISRKVKDTIIDYTKKLGLGIGIKGLYNIQFIVAPDESVYIIEVNPRSSRTVPFLSKATSFALADIATLVTLGHTLKEQGFSKIYPKEKERFYVKVPVFSFAKLNGVDAYLSPEMKSTGEAIGYDEKIHRAAYKAMIASGMKMQNYGTLLVTLADEDKEEALPLVKRFYKMGFNIEATTGTAVFLKEHGIKTRLRGKMSEGSSEILDTLRQGHVAYLICTRAILSGIHYQDGAEIRATAIQNGVTMFTSLDTVKLLLDVLEEMTLPVSVI